MEPFTLSRDEVDFEHLAAYLKALAHPGRLELLWRLRIPSRSAELAIQPSRQDAGLPPERAMSRQSVEAHLATLEETGVVNRVESAEGAAPQWVTSPQRVFALIEDLRRLTAIRPAMRVDVDATFAQEAPMTPAWPTGPKLVLASGPWEGRVFMLEGEGPWSVGRSRAMDIALTYDPFVSADHARVLRTSREHTLQRAEGARNPSRVNFSDILDGAPHPLRAGDVVGVGRSLLVFQPA